MRSTTESPLGLDLAEGIARMLLAAYTARRIYAPGHDRVQSSVRTLVNTICNALREGGTHTIRLTVTGSTLTHEGIPLSTGRGGVGQFARLLEERQCGGIAFRPAVSETSITGLLGWLVERRGRPAARSFPGVELLPRGVGEGAGSGVEGSHPLDDLLPEFSGANRLHTTAYGVLGHIMDDLRAQREIDFSEVVELTQWTAEMVYSEGNRIVAGSQLAEYDSYTFGHSVNVFLVATTLLQPFARDRQELARLAQAALLHDVGKCHIPSEILEKRGNLTDEEFAVIRRHPEHGAKILHACPHTDSLAAEVAFCHHMRDDGYGYPTPSVPVKVGPVAAIVQVADMFEALTSHRPYHRGLSTCDALRTIQRTAGMRSRRAAIALLLERLTNSPPGSQVRLRTGERGLVLETFPDAPDRPRVRILESAAGVPVEQPYDVDLREFPPGFHPVAEVFLKPSLPRSGKPPSEAVHASDS